MVLDTTVMNVSISQVVADLNTTVVGLQTAITLYTLVMASLMLIGGKLGERWGAKRTFAVGLLVYGTGSFITSISPNLAVLLLGWSLIEGLGAVLVIPAIAALTAATYQGKQRAVAYGILGGVSGASMAAGPADRRLGVGRVLLALRLRRRVRRGRRHPAVPADRSRHQGPPDQARHHRCRAVGARAGLHRARRSCAPASGAGSPPSAGVPEVNGQPVDAAGAVPDAVADRDRLDPAGRVRAPGTTGQGPRRRTPARPRPPEDPADARRAGGAVVPGLHHPGHLLRAAPVPADRAGLRLAQDRGDDPAHVRGHVHLRPRRLRADRPLHPQADRPARHRGHARRRAVPARTSSTHSSAGGGSASGSRCSAPGLGLLASQVGNVIMSSVEPKRGGEAGGLQGTVAQPRGVARRRARRVDPARQPRRPTSPHAIQASTTLPDSVKQQVTVAAQASANFVSTTRSSRPRRMPACPRTRPTSSWPPTPTPSSPRCGPRSRSSPCSPCSPWPGCADLPNSSAAVEAKSPVAEDQKPNEGAHHEGRHRGWGRRRGVLRRPAAQARRARRRSSWSSGGPTCRSRTAVCRTTWAG